MFIESKIVMKKIQIQDSDSDADDTEDSASDSDLVLSWTRLLWTRLLSCLGLGWDGLNYNTDSIILSVASLVK